MPQRETAVHLCGLNVKLSSYALTADLAMNLRLRILTVLAAMTVFGLGDVRAQDSAIPLGSPMPALDARLTDGSGNATTLGARRGATYTAVLFWGNKCPWTGRYEDRIKLLGSELSGPGKVILLINSNDSAAFPAEAAPASAQYAAEKGLTIPYLADPDSKVARAFGATRTPQAFVFDSAGTLVYSGAIDDSPGDPDNVSKDYLRDVLLALAQAQPINAPETKAFGCMIRPVR